MREDLKSLGHHKTPDDMKGKVIKMHEQGIDPHLIAERFGKSTSMINGIIRRHVKAKYEEAAKV